MPEPNAPWDDPQLLAEWFAVAWSHEIALGTTLPRHILGQDLVLWRSTQGLHCWRDLCIHRGAKLSLGKVELAQPDLTESSPEQNLDSASSAVPNPPKPDCLICPYHAWAYAPTGECVHIPAQPHLQPPAKARAHAWAVQERYGVVWVCFSDPSPLPPLPEFPLCEQPGFRTVLAGPYRWRALGPRVVENLLDVGHLGIVHAGLLGDPAHADIEDYEVLPGTPAIGPQAKNIRIWQPDPDGTGTPALVTYHYWVAGLLTAGLIKSSGNSGEQFAILAQVAPIDQETCESRLIMTLNYGHHIPEADLLRFQDHVTEQDRHIVESQRPELLPLDLQAELHLRSDRMAIAYRKWLQAMGLRYGTA